MIKLSVSTISFVLSLTDDFTGKDAMDERHAFFVNGRVCNPIRKREGYYVFVDLPGEVFSVAISSGRYHGAETTVTRSVVPVDVRLYRNGAYFPDCAYIKGQGEANAIISREFPYEPVLKLKEIVTIQEQTQLVLYGYGLRNLCGLRFSMGKKAKKESFLLGERVTANSYTTVPPIKHRHEESSELLRCYRTMCDSIGRYCLPIDKYIEEGR